MDFPHCFPAKFSIAASLLSAVRSAAGQTPPLFAGAAPAPGPAALLPEAPPGIAVTAPWPGAAECEVETSGPICLGDTVLLPPALPAGLVGYWSFDDALPLDKSGHGAHGQDDVASGPAFGGQGSSVSFHKTHLLIPGQPQLQLTDFSYTFWVYIIDHKAGSEQQLCPLLRKGLDSASRASEGGSLYASTPAVFFHSQSRQLYVEIATTTDNLVRVVEGFESNARLKPGQWFHVAIVRFDQQRKTRLYVNGILDSSGTTKGFAAASAEPLYVGGDPSTEHTCDVSMYIDELKIYNRHLEADEIQAEAAPALAGIEPSFVRLACVNCPLELAMENCPDGYHICNSLELHIGGYQVARSLGWLSGSSSAHIWSHTATANTKLQARGDFSAFHSSPQHAAGATSSGLSLRAAVAPAPAPIGGAAAGVGGGGGLGLGMCCADDTTSTL